MSTTLGPSTMAQIAAMRPYLMRVARSRINDEHHAEELVQETLLAAIRSHRTFEGQSRFRTWVTGILMHKVTDCFRARARESAVLEPLRDDEAGEQAQFDREGHWTAPMSPWSDPERALEDKRFRQLFAQSLERLSPLQSRAFELRELMGLDTGEICAALEVTPNHLYQLLHRARLELRRSLDRDWFSAAA